VPNGTAPTSGAGLPPIADGDSDGSGDEATTTPTAATTAAAVNAAAAANIGTRSTTTAQTAAAAKNAAASSTNSQSSDTPTTDPNQVSQQSTLAGTPNGSSLPNLALGDQPSGGKSGNDTSLTNAPADGATPASPTALDPSQAAAIAVPTAQPNAATASAAANTSAQQVSGAVPIAGVAVEIVARAQSGKNQFEIRLDPPELGRIDVKLDVDRSGNVTSQLVVDKPETLSLLRNSAPQLERALQDAGLKTGDGGLQFSLRDQSSSGQNQNQNANTSTPTNTTRLVIPDEDAAPVAAVRGYGRMLGASGGVDIRV
jgi:chemotaxis protein MotD